MKIFEMPVVEVKLFAAEDIIATSWQSEGNETGRV